MNKINVKDLINIGVFTALYLVLFFMASFLGYVPVLFPALPVICAAVVGIPFMLFLSRVHTFGMITKRMGLLKRMEYQLVPVMMSTVRIADELSQASMTKGLGGSDKRTHICKVGFRVQDYVLILILGIMLILYTVY